MRYDVGAQVAPAAVLWADPDRTWESVVGKIQESVPVLELAATHEAGTASGPAIWLRAVLAASGGSTCDDGSVVGLPSTMASHDASNPWVVYLPGIARADLVGDRQATADLAPLVELAHRSVWWQQSNQQP